jgi:hypothetical protein
MPKMPSLSFIGYAKQKAWFLFCFISLSLDADPSLDRGRWAKGICGFEVEQTDVFSCCPKLTAKS